MTYENLLLDQTGPVLKITVNRPEVRNAQSRIMLEEFDDALMKAVDDESVRVIIVAGAGEHFSSGHDLGSPRRRPTGSGAPILRESQARTSEVGTRTLRTPSAGAMCPSPQSRRCRDTA